MSESPRRPGLEQEEDHVHAAGAYALAFLGVLLVVFSIWAGIELAQSLAGRRTSPSTAEQTPPRMEEVERVRTIGSLDVTDILADSTTRTNRLLRRERLAAYGWADRGRGMVTIPIGRAMELVAERTRGEALGPTPTSPANAVPRIPSAAGAAPRDSAAGVAGPGPERAAPPDTVAPDTAGRGEEPR